MQKIFNYPAQQDSNELPLRRRMLYPLSYWGICFCILQCFSCLVKLGAAVQFRTAARFLSPDRLMEREDHGAEKLFGQAALCKKRLELFLGKRL